MPSEAVGVGGSALIRLLRRRLVAVLSFPAAGIGGGAMVNAVLVEALDIRVFGHG